MLSALRQLPWIRTFVALVLITSTGCTAPPSWSDPFSLMSQRQTVPDELTAVSRSIGDSSDYKMASYQRPAKPTSRNSSSCRTGSG